MKRESSEGTTTTTNETSRTIKKSTSTTTRKKIRDKRKVIAGRRRNPSNEVKPRKMPQKPEDENRFYVIEQLLDKRISSITGDEEYLVRWRNYPPEWDSWEPRIEIERNALDMVLEYNRIGQFGHAELLHCICRRPYRFDHGGMIQCFNCRTWFHFTCLKMDMVEANSYSLYYCQECRDNNANLVNKIKQEQVDQIHSFY